MQGADVTVGAPDLVAERRLGTVEVALDAEKVVDVGEQSAVVDNECGGLAERCLVPEARVCFVEVVGCGVVSEVDGTVPLVVCDG